MTTRCARTSDGPTTLPASPLSAGDHLGGLLQHRLLEVARGDPDFAAQRGDLVRREPFANIGFSCRSPPRAA